MFQTAHKSFENVAQFKHLGMATTEHNCIQQSIKSRLYSVQNFLSFRLLPKNVHTKLIRLVSCMG